MQLIRKEIAFQTYWNLEFAVRRDTFAKMKTKDQFLYQNHKKNCFGNTNKNVTFGKVLD